MKTLEDMPDRAATGPDHNADINRRQAQARAWQKRAKRMQRLRILLPGLIIGILGLVVVWIIVQSVLNSLNVYGTGSVDVRMLNPLYTDRGSDGSRYTLRGVEAVRSGTTSAITLTAPRLEVRSQNGRGARLESANGLYDNDRRTITLQSGVLINSRDVNLNTERALIDLNDTTVSGSDPVDATWPGGEVRAQGFRIEDNGNRLHFSGKGETKVTGTLRNAN